MKKQGFKKALVASGGGAWGAWGGGTIEGLCHKNGMDYDVFVGSSTGVLLSPLTALDEMGRLKKAYTSVTQKSIFNVNPFNKKGGISPWNAIWRMVFVNPISKVFRRKYKPTLGESKPLRETIKTFFKEEDYRKIREELGKEIVAVVTNLNTGMPEYKSSHDCGYEDFVDWMWASANVPMFMSLVKKDGSEYVDGGIVEHIPIQGAIDRDVDEIDVIVHRPEEYAADSGYESTNTLKLLVRTNNIMHREISKNDIAISKLRAKDKDVKINIYYTPYKLSSNSLVFDKAVMERWWDLGHKGAEEGSATCDQWVLKKDNTLKRVGK